MGIGRRLQSLVPRAVFFIAVPYFLHLYFLYSTYAHYYQELHLEEVTGRLVTIYFYLPNYALHEANIT